MSAYGGSAHCSRGKRVQQSYHQPRLQRDRTDQFHYNRTNRNHGERTESYHGDGTESYHGEGTESYHGEGTESYHGEGTESYHGEGSESYYSEGTESYHVDRTESYHVAGADPYCVNENVYYQNDRIDNYHRGRSHSSQGNRSDSSQGTRSENFHSDINPDYEYSESEGLYNEESINFGNQTRHPSPHYRSVREQSHERRTLLGDPGATDRSHVYSEQCVQINERRTLLDDTSLKSASHMVNESLRPRRTLLGDREVEHKLNESDGHYSDMVDNSLEQFTENEDYEMCTEYSKKDKPGFSGLNDLCDDERNFHRHKTYGKPSMPPQHYPRGRVKRTRGASVSKDVDYTIESHGKVKHEQRHATKSEPSDNVRMHGKQSHLLPQKASQHHKHASQHHKRRKEQNVDFEDSFRRHSSDMRKTGKVLLPTPYDNPVDLHSRIPSFCSEEKKHSGLLPTPTARPTMSLDQGIQSSVTLTTRSASDTHQRGMHPEVGSRVSTGLLPTPRIQPNIQSPHYSSDDTSRILPGSHNAFKSSLCDNIVEEKHVEDDLQLDVPFETGLMNVNHPRWTAGSVTHTTRQPPDVHRRNIHPKNQSVAFGLLPTQRIKTNIQSPLYSSDDNSRILPGSHNAFESSLCDNFVEEKHVEDDLQLDVPFETGLMNVNHPRWTVGTHTTQSPPNTQRNVQPKMQSVSTPLLLKPRIQTNIISPLSGCEDNSRILPESLKEVNESLGGNAVAEKKAIDDADQFVPFETGLMNVKHPRWAKSSTLHKNKSIFESSSTTVASNDSVTAEVQNGSDNNNVAQMAKQYHLQVELTKALEGMQRTMQSLNEKIKKAPKIRTPKDKKPDQAPVGHTEKELDSSECKEGSTEMLKPGLDTIDVDNNHDLKQKNNEGVKDHMPYQVMEVSHVEESPEQFPGANDELSKTSEEVSEIEQLGTSKEWCIIPGICEDSANVNCGKYNSHSDKSDTAGEHYGQTGRSEYKTYKEWRLAKQRMDHYFSSDNDSARELNKDKRQVPGFEKYKQSDKIPELSRPIDNKSHFGHRRYSSTHQEYDSERHSSFDSLPGQRIDTSAQHRDGDINSRRRYQRSSSRSSTESDQWTKRKDNSVASSSPQCQTDNSKQHKPMRNSEKSHQSVRDCFRIQEYQKKHDGYRNKISPECSKSPEEHTRHQGSLKSAKSSEHLGQSSKSNYSREDLRRNIDRPERDEKVECFRQSLKYDRGPEQHKISLYREKHVVEHENRNQNYAEHLNVDTSIVTGFERSSDKDVMNRSRRNDNLVDSDGIKTKSIKYTEFEKNVSQDNRDENLFAKFSVNSVSDETCETKPDRNKRDAETCDKVKFHHNRTVKIPLFDIMKGKYNEKNQEIKKQDTIHQTSKLSPPSKSILSTSKSSKSDRENIFEKLSETFSSSSAVSVDKDMTCKKEAKTLSKPVVDDSSSEDSEDVFSKFNAILTKERKPKTFIVGSTKSHEKIISKNSKEMPSHISVVSDSNTSDLSEIEERLKLHSGQTIKKKKEFVKYLRRVNKTLFWKKYELKPVKIRLQRLSENHIHELKKKVKKEDKHAHQKNLAHKLSADVLTTKGLSQNSCKIQNLKEQKSASNCSGNEKKGHLCIQQKLPEKYEAISTIMTEKFFEDNKVEATSFPVSEDSVHNVSVENEKGAVFETPVPERSMPSTSISKQKADPDRNIKTKRFRRIILPIPSTSENSESDIERKVLVSQREQVSPVISDSEDSGELEGSLGAEDDSLYFADSVAIEEIDTSCEKYIESECSESEDKIVTTVNVGSVMKGNSAVCDKTEELIADSKSGNRSVGSVGTKEHESRIKPKKAKNLFKSSPKSHLFPQLDGHSDPLYEISGESSGDEGDVEDNSDDDIYASQDLFNGIDGRNKYLSTPCKSSQAPCMSKNDNSEVFDDVGKHRNSDDQESSELPERNTVTFVTKSQKIVEADDSTNEDSGTPTEEENEGNVPVKDEPSWLLNGYTQEPDTIFLSDDDEMVMSNSQPVILVSDEDSTDAVEDEIPVVSSIKKVKKESLDDQATEQLLGDSSSAEDWSDKGSDFEPENLFRNFKEISKSNKTDKFDQQSLSNDSNISSEGEAFHLPKKVKREDSSDAAMDFDSSDEAVMSVKEEYLSYKPEKTKREPSGQLEREVEVNAISSGDDELLATCAASIEKKLRKKTGASVNVSQNGRSSTGLVRDLSNGSTESSSNSSHVGMSLFGRQTSVRSIGSSYEEMTPFNQDTQIDPEISRDDSLKDVSVFNFHSEHFSDIKANIEKKPGEWSDDSDIMILDDSFDTEHRKQCVEKKQECNSLYQAMTQVKKSNSSKSENLSSDFNESDDMYDAETQIDVLKARLKKPSIGLNIAVDDISDAEEDEKNDFIYEEQTQYHKVGSVEGISQELSGKNSDSNDEYEVQTQVVKSWPIIEDISDVEESGKSSIADEFEAQTQLDNAGPSKVKDVCAVFEDITDDDSENQVFEDPQFTNYFQETQVNVRTSYVASNSILGVEYDEFSTDKSDTPDEDVYNVATQVDENNVSSSTIKYDEYNESTLVDVGSVLIMHDVYSASTQVDDDDDELPDIDSDYDVANILFDESTESSAGNAMERISHTKNDGDISMYIATKVSEQSDNDPSMDDPFIAATQIDIQDKPLLGIKDNILSSNVAREKYGITDKDSKVRGFLIPQDQQGNDDCSDDMMDLYGSATQINAVKKVEDKSSRIKNKTSDNIEMIAGHEKKTGVENITVALLNPNLDDLKDPYESATQIEVMNDQSKVPRSSYFNTVLHQSNESTIKHCGMMDSDEYFSDFNAATQVDMDTSAEFQNHDYDFNMATQIDEVQVINSDSSTDNEVADKYESAAHTEHRVRETNVGLPNVVKVTIEKESDVLNMQRTAISVVKRSNTDAISKTVTFGHNDGISALKKPRISLGSTRQILPTVPQRLKTVKEKRSSGVRITPVCIKTSVAVPSSRCESSPDIDIIDANSKDMWLSKKKPQPSGIPDRGKDSRFGKRKRKEDPDSSLKAKMQAARSQLRERSMHCVSKPEATSKRIKKTLSVPSTELEDVALPTNSQIIGQGLPILNPVGILQKGIKSGTSHQGETVHASGHCLVSTSSASSVTITVSSSSATMTVSSSMPASLITSSVTDTTCITSTSVLVPGLADTTLTSNTWGTDKRQKTIEKVYGIKVSNSVKGAHNGPNTGIKDDKKCDVAKKVNDRVKHSNTTSHKSDKENKDRSRRKSAEEKSCRNKDDKGKGDKSKTSSTTSVSSKPRKENSNTVNSSKTDTMTTGCSATTGNIPKPSTSRKCVWNKETVIPGCSSWGTESSSEPFKKTTMQSVNGTFSKPTSLSNNQMKDLTPRTSANSTTNNLNSGKPIASVALSYDTTVCTNSRTTVTMSDSSTRTSVRLSTSTHIQSSVLQKQRSQGASMSTGTHQGVTTTTSRSRQPFQTVPPNVPVAMETCKMVDRSTPLLWHDFLKVILRWNPLWLLEKERFERNNQRVPMPPITNDLFGHNNHTLYPLVPRYENYKEYSETFMLPLLLHETWESCYSTWRQNKNNDQLIDHKVCFSHRAPKKERTTYTLLGLISDKDRWKRRFVSEGELVKISAPGTEKVSETKTKQTTCEMLGYVDAVVFKEPSVNRIVNHFKCLNEVKNGMIDCISMKITVTVRKRAFEPSATEIIHIQSVSPLVNTYRQFNGLALLPRSPLCQSLLYPTSNMIYCDKAPAMIQNEENKMYNKSQSIAINTAAKICGLAPEVPRVCLLQGPPGTGKSHTIIGIIKEILKVRKGSYRICLCAQSNAAVDELLRRLLRYRESAKNKPNINIVRLGKPSSVHREIQDICLDHLVDRNIKRVRKDQNLKTLPKSLQAGMQSLKNHISKLKDEIKSASELKRQKLNIDLKEKEKDLERQESKYFKPQNKPTDHNEESKMRREILLKAHVVAGTLSSIGLEIIRTSFQNIKQAFHVAIIDEATQAIELETLIPLQYGVSKLILVGDPQQLPPTVVSQIAAEHKLNLSLFERLDSHFRSLQNNVPNPVILLDTQYRMNPEIAVFPNEYVYSGELKNDRSVIERRKCNLTPYILFNVSEGRELFSQGTRSMSNLLEAKFTAELCELIVSEKAFKAREIGVIAPYARQKAEVRQLLNSKELSDIEVSTVDGFQGREKNVIIMTCVRANMSGSVGFVGKRSRMNVSLTRAKYAMYLVGNIDSLESSEEWKVLIDNARERGKIVSVDKNRFKESLQEVILKKRK